MEFKELNEEQQKIAHKLGFSGLFAEKANLQEAYEFASALAETLGNDQGTMLTGIHVLINSFSVECARHQQKTPDNNFYEIDGYFKDNKDHQFEGYLVYGFDCVPEGYDDDSIFFYGLDEVAIKEAIKLVEATCHEFVITSYRKVEN